jgi:protein-S-isoprenylcysteine O-methyltransferase Ste14
LYELVFDGIISAVSIGVIAQYAWSVKAHFTSPKTPDGAKIISAAVAVTGLLYMLALWRINQPLSAQIAGLLLQLLSVALFWWAISASKKARLRFAFDKEAPASLLQDGPYAYVRHPFYTSYILFWTGWAVATWTPWAFPPLGFLIAVYVRAARDEESNFTSTAFADAYVQYRKRAGLFWPKLWAG